jgi:DNA-binding transcriptional regulator YbjK
MRDRRSLVLRTGLDVIADGGAKALTHRAIDRAAGLPLGSTANLYGTREALLVAMIEEFERQDVELLGRISDGFPPATVTELVDGLTELALLATAGPTARLTRARLSLFIEHPEAISPAHQRVHELLCDALAALEVPEPEPTAARVAAYLDGLALHSVTTSAATPASSKEVRTALALLVTSQH